MCLRLRLNLASLTELWLTSDRLRPRPSDAHFAPSLSQYGQTSPTFCHLVPKLHQPKWATKWHLAQIAVATHAQSPSHVGIQGHRCSLVLCTHSPKCKVFGSAPAVTYHLGKSCCSDLCLGWHRAMSTSPAFPIRSFLKWSMSP